jgi:hypothetical protein
MLSVWHLSMVHPIQRRWLAMVPVRARIQRPKADLSGLTGQAHSQPEEADQAQAHGHPEEADKVEGHIAGGNDWVCLIISEEFPFLLTTVNAGPLPCTHVRFIPVHMQTCVLLVWMWFCLFCRSVSMISRKLAQQLPRGAAAARTMQRRTMAACFVGGSAQGIEEGRQCALQQGGSMDDGRRRTSRTFEGVRH